MKMPKEKNISNTPQGSRTLRRGMRIRYVNRYTRGVLVSLKCVAMEVADRWYVLFAGRCWVRLRRLKGRCSYQTASSFLEFKAGGQLPWTDATQQRFLFAASRLAALVSPTSHASFCADHPGTRKAITACQAQGDTDVLGPRFFSGQNSRLDDWVSWGPQILVLSRLGRLKTALEHQKR